MMSVHSIGRRRCTVAVRSVGAMSPRTTVGPRAAQQGGASSVTERVSPVVGVTTARTATATVAALRALGQRNDLPSQTAAQAYVAGYLDAARPHPPGASRSDSQVAARRLLARIEAGAPVANATTGPYLHGYLDGSTRPGDPRVAGTRDLEHKTARLGGTLWAT
jgi:hypothetical protein